MVVNLKAEKDYTIDRDVKNTIHKSILSLLQNSQQRLSQIKYILLNLTKNKVDNAMCVLSVLARNSETFSDKIKVK